MGTQDVNTEFWKGNVKERQHWESMGVDGKTTLNIILKNSMEGFGPDKFV
jgi:hypothetical protein